MLKKGFTLSEALLAIGIVAIVSALVAPAVNSIKPDRYKNQVLKAYSDISNVTASLLDDASIYYSTIRRDESGNPIVTNGVIERSCVGLACTGTPVNPQYNNATYSGVNKYTNLLADRLNLTASGENFVRQTDASVWTITYNAQTGVHSVTIDMDSKNTNNCHFNNACTAPDSFIFRVNDNGEVTAGDALTYAYILNPYKTNKESDRKAAKKALSKFND